MLTQIQTAEQFAEVVREVGGLIPVPHGAFLAGVSDRALRLRLERGTMRGWAVNGGVFVSVLDCERRGNSGRQLPS